MRKKLLIISCILFFLVISSYAQEKSLTREPISIEFPGIVLNSDKNFLGTDMRIWYQGNGIEYYDCGKWLDYSLRRFRYIRKIKDNNYLGIGIGEGKYKTSLIGGIGFPPPTTTPTAEYVENPIYLSFGIEDEFFFDWLRWNAEVGGVIPIVNSFTGDRSLYPQSRFYLSAGVRCRINM
jgi:hypothetical protein